MEKNYKKRKAIGHKVFHEFSGRSHFYNVRSDSGNTHNVMIQVGCDCTYMGVQGSANHNICSHILAVLNNIGMTGDIKINNGNETMLGLRRNACMLLVRRSNRCLNELRVSPGETPEHMNKKAEICKRLMEEGKHYICEAIFEKGEGRADILVLDDFKVIEIVKTESNESIQEKLRKYPQGIKIEVIRC